MTFFELLTVLVWGEKSVRLKNHRLKGYVHCEGSGDEVLHEGSCA